jgi:TRAP-type C4-dicarboxylate transport system permease small subunit
VNTKAASGARRLVRDKHAAKARFRPDDASETVPEDSLPAGGLGAIAGSASRRANAVAICFTILLAVTFIYEVIARRVFGNPTGFANQLAAYGMPLIMFLSAAYTLERGGHVIVDAFVRTLKPKPLAKLEIVTDAMSVVLLLAVTVITTGVVVQSWQTGYRTFSTVLTFPEYIPQIVMPVGFALLTLQQIATLIGSIRNHGRRKRETILIEEI